MRFVTPLALLGLLVVPVLLAVHLRRERERRHDADAFAPALLLPSVAPVRPGWRRHVPVACVMLALALLVIAAARPRTHSVETINGSAIMLANDVSGSMAATDIKPNRITAAQRAADTLVLALPRNVRVGSLMFDQDPTVLQLPTTDHLAVLRALGRLRVMGGTATGNAVMAALSILRSTPQPIGGRPTRAIVLISDGDSTSGVSPLSAAKQAGQMRIPIYTVALGTPNGKIDVKFPNGRTAVEPAPPDPTLLASMAKASGGKTFTATDAKKLTDIYRQLGGSLGRHTVTHELALAFVLAALAALAAALVGSLAWFGRLI
ncbi:MAG TPA: VWA domain-containing protein [Solirubrobacteraceae bacterium]|jgi:Ca-activated chloride channel family protein|nr:VWA domain-containing protein [Solirubrobacteraceae bacterium]